MATPSSTVPTVIDREPRPVFAHEILHVVTPAPTSFIDLTDRLNALIQRMGADMGLLHVQTRHTTTGILVNEYEPLLLLDIADRLEYWAPLRGRYRHDDPTRRTVNVTPDERRNGHAHCRAMLLRASECLHIVDGRLALGRWQRVLFVELDGPREREVSVIVQG